MADDNANRRTIVGVDAAFQSMRDVRGWGCELVKCKKCGEPAPSFNADGFCSFCDLTMALNVIGVARIHVTARFIWAGTC